MVEEEERVEDAGERMVRAEEEDEEEEEGDGE